MVGKITPVYAPRPTAVLGWDGTDFCVIKIDVNGHLQVDALTAATGLDALLNALKSVNTDKLHVEGADPLFSYKNNLVGAWSGAISGANGYLESAAVPASMVWVITGMSVWDATTATTVHSYNINRSGTLYCFYEARAAFAIGQHSSALLNVFLGEADKLRVYFTGGLAANTCNINVVGYTMSRP